jgi:hypothetical protein
MYHILNAIKILKEKERSTVQYIRSKTTEAVHREPENQLDICNEHTTTRYFEPI